MGLLTGSVDARAMMKMISLHAPDTRSFATCTPVPGLLAPLPPFSGLTAPDPALPEPWGCGMAITAPANRIRADGLMSKKRMLLKLGKVRNEGLNIHRTCCLYVSQVVSVCLRLLVIQWLNQHDSE